MGSKMAIWTGLFFWIEDAWDDVRGTRDAANTVLASATVAGGFSLWSEYPQRSIPSNERSQAGRSAVVSQKQTGRASARLNAL